MISNEAVGLDREILALLGQRALSPSHDKTHTDLVLKFALQLQALHGGDEEVLIAAARLHDLGRDDPRKRGVASIRDSVLQAKVLLGQTGIDEKKIAHVAEAISQHDQPRMRPTSLEGRILKDADFLAGMGTTGMLRISMWAGETGEGFDGIKRRVQDRMPERVLNLEFPESRRYAFRECLRTNYFLEDLIAEHSLPEPCDGKYIIFEGISGSGKDTQLNLLTRKLELEGTSHELVREPTPEYKKLRERYEGIQDDGGLVAEEVMFLLLATRFEQVRKTIEPALQRGDIVLANRSFLSTIIYQGNKTFGPSFIALMHCFVPSPDLVLLFDLEPQSAFDRLQKSDREQFGAHESLASLYRDRPLYRDLTGKVFGESRVVRIDAGESEQDVHLQVLRAVQKALGKDGGPLADTSNPEAAS